MAPKLEMSPYPISSIKMITMLGVLEFSFSEQEKRSREKRVRYMIKFFIFFVLNSNKIRSSTLLIFHQKF